MRNFRRTVFCALFGSSMLLCPVAHAATETVLYAFKSMGDAGGPVGGLAVVGNTIYGASPFGGPRGDGAVFAVTTSGVETLVHLFKGGGGGQNPQAGFIAVGGALYGTVLGGFCKGCRPYGQFIRVSLSGREDVEYRFKGVPDGEDPVASLLRKSGTFYGTTQHGGGGSCVNDGYTGCGTVLSVTPAGVEKVLYAFTGGADGGYPQSDLVWEDGLLYGTAAAGGSHGDGVVFSVSPSGKEQILHSFQGNRDGANPGAGLFDVGGIFYGTTGGGEHGNGTIFSITKAGQKKLLYRFRGGSDGAVPSGDLIQVGGTLYGTTFNGGGGPCTANGKGGCGTVFSVTPDGTETVLHAFQSGPVDGAYPRGPLVTIGGDLYGVTVAGGNGQGTVFVITP